MDSDLLLLERLSDRDLAVLAAAAGDAGSDAGSDAGARGTRRAARLRDEPGHIDGLLARPEVFDALFGPHREDPLLVVGPFVAFAVLLAHAPTVLAGRAFVQERIGSRHSVPLFEVEPLREFVADPLRRLFLADLLASYTHVASGALWVKSRRGWRHQRFSELDPAQFAGLILSVPPDQRLVLYRRLGDLSLFLTGVFPDHVEAHPLPPVAVERLIRAVGEGGPAAGGRHEPASQVADLGALRLLEWLGERTYRLAWEGAAYRDFGSAGVVGYAAEHFRHARLILNFLTDGYLFAHRERWFTPGSN
jgi:hypothetical protein